MVVCNYLTCSEVPFKYLSFFFEHINAARGKKKAAHLRAFREKYINRASDDIFQIYRLILPQLDKVRGNYWLKEAKLVAALVKACGLDPKTSADAQAALGWKKFGTEKAGHFSFVMEEYLFFKHCGKRDDAPGVTDLTVGQLNDKLTELASAEDSSNKAECLRWLIVRTSSKQMRWIVQIILKDLKVGLSETRVFSDFHADAEHLYNVTMDLESICKQLKDPNKRYPRKDIEPGDAARPQLAARAMSTEAAFKKLKGSPFVVEIKFDGERVQLHRDGSQYWYFSRRGKDHGAESTFHVFDTIATASLRPERCILDGEMILWNKTKKCFEPFGTLRTAFMSARKGAGPNDLLETNQSVAPPGVGTTQGESPRISDIILVYIAFDILYKDDQSVINRPLRERHRLLSAAIKDSPSQDFAFVGKSSLQGAVLPLLPGVPFLNEPGFSRTGQTTHDIQEVYDVAIGRREEGIVCKALDSQWRFNDRSGSWLKVKPDYISDHEIDAVIMGCFYGTGRHGGMISEFLLGLVDTARTASSQVPLSLVSFCKVGTGLSDVEKSALREHLNENLLEHGKPPPRCYRISGDSKEMPDVWIKNPASSVVIQVRADIRIIPSKVFAAKYSLRFPRADRIRWDKSPGDAMTEHELQSLVESSKGQVTQAPKPQEEDTPKRQRKGKILSPSKGSRPTLIPYLAPCQLSGIDVEEDALQGAAICVLDSGKFSKEEVETSIRRMGGTVYMGITPSVKYVLASSENQNYKVKSVVRSGNRDILSVDWVMRCSHNRCLLPPRPQDYVFRPAKERSPAHCMLDYPPDMQFDKQDVKAMLASSTSNHDDSSYGSAEDTIDVLKSMLPPPPSKFAFLSNCRMLFIPLGNDMESGCPYNTQDQGCEDHQNLLYEAVEIMKLAESSYKESEETSWRQLQLDVVISGGQMQSTLDEATTHIIISSDAVSCHTILQHLHDAEATLEDLKELKRRISTGSIQIASKDWLQSCMDSTELKKILDLGRGPWPWDEYFALSVSGQKRGRVEEEEAEGKKARKKRIARRKKPNQQPDYSSGENPAEGDDRKLDEEVSRVTTRSRHVRKFEPSVLSCIDEAKGEEVCPENLAAEDEDVSKEHQAWGSYKVEESIWLGSGHEYMREEVKVEHDVDIGLSSPQGLIEDESDGKKEDLGRSLMKSREERPVVTTVVEQPKKPPGTKKKSLRDRVKAALGNDD